MNSSNKWIAGGVEFPRTFWLTLKGQTRRAGIPVRLERHDSSGKMVVWVRGKRTRTEDARNYCRTAPQRLRKACIDSL